jgi:hypothetical protein
MSAQVSAVCAGAVSLVGPDLIGPCAGTACADARDVDAVQDGLELERVAALPAVTTSDSTYWPCSQARWIFVVSPPRERPSACRLVLPRGHWRLLLLAGVSAGAGGVLVRPGDR